VTFFEFEGRRPQVHPDAWIAPTATLIGDVRIARGASIWFGAVLRGDVGPILIGEKSNVQDNSVLHVKTGEMLEIGAASTIAHACCIHGRSVGDGSLIGNSATLLDGSVVGSRCLVAAGSLVSPGTHIPDGSLAIGTPAKVRQRIEPGTTAHRLLETNAQTYVDLMERHRAGIRPID
jgi:carbonic anhydrase/acetyltransferase-like protein (isoleucine patch superfamily)